MRADGVMRLVLAGATVALTAGVATPTRERVETIQRAPLRDVAIGLWRGRLPRDEAAPKAAATPLRATVPALHGVSLFLPGAGAGAPVVVFVAGLGGSADGASGLIDRLVAAGFAVVALDDIGRGLVIDLGTQEAFGRFVADAEAMVERDARRVAAALDALASAPAAGGLRLDRVGAVGFSFGGAVAAHWARLDPRVVAAVNLDGWLFGAPGTPLLTVGGDEPPPSGPEGARRAALDLRDLERIDALPGASLVTLRAVRHGDFIDASLDRRAWRGWLRVDPRRVQARAVALAADFVRAALR